MFSLCRQVPRPGKWWRGWGPPSPQGSLWWPVSVKVVFVKVHAGLLPVSCWERAAARYTQNTSFPLAALWLLGRGAGVVCVSADPHCPPLSWSLALTLAHEARPLLRGSATPWCLGQGVAFLGSGPSAQAELQLHGSWFSACQQHRFHTLATHQACPSTALQGAWVLLCWSVSPWGPCGCLPSQENTKDPPSPQGTRSHSTSGL